MRLLTRLGAPAPIALLIAAPGFGKSVLAEHWLEHCREQGLCPVRLALEPDDGDPAILARRLWAAIAAEVPGLPLLEASRDDAESQVAALATALGTVPPVALSIDDLTVADTPGVSSLLRSLATSVPASSRMLLASRGRSSVRLADEIARGRVRVIRSDELRFTVAEAHELFDGVLSRRMAKEAVRLTEGWPVALQFLRLAIIQADCEPADCLRSFGGITPDLERYLADILRAELPEDVTAFVLESAALDFFSGDLLNAALERSDSWELIDQLERGGLFIERAGGGTRLLRFPALVAEFLRDRLHRRDPPRAAAVRRRAAQWLAASGETELALQAAAAAGDPLLSAALLDGAGGWRFALRSGCSAIAGVRALEPEQLARYPRAAFALIYETLQEGRAREARVMLDRVLAHHPSLSAPATRNPARAALAIEARQIDLITRMYADRPILGEELDELERANVAAERHDPLIAGPMLTLMSVYRLAGTGDLKGADRLSTRLLDGLDRFGIPYFSLWARVAAAVVSLGCGRPREADALLRQCLASGEAGGDTNPPREAARVMLAVVADERGETLDGHSLDIELMNRLDACYAWFDILEPAFEALAARITRSSSVEDSVRLLDERCRLFDARDCPRIVRLFELLAVRELARAGDLERASSRAEDFDLVTLAHGGVPVGHRDRRLQDPARFTLGRLHLAAGRGEEALKELVAARTAFQECGALRWIPRVLVSEAVAAERCGNRPLALERLADSIRAAAPEQLRRAFADDAQALQPLLLELQRSGKEILRGAAGELLDDLVSGGQANGRDRGTHLSPRESGVLAMLADGLSSKEMARQLGIAESTVKGYRKSLFEKLAVHTRAQAIAAGRARDLIP